MKKQQISSHTTMNRGSQLKQKPAHTSTESAASRAQHAARHAPLLPSRRSSTERLRLPRNTPSRSSLSSHYLFFSRALRKFFPNGAMFLGTGGCSGPAIQKKKQKATRYSPGSMARHGTRSGTLAVWSVAPKVVEKGGRWGGEGVPSPTLCSRGVFKKKKKKSFLRFER